MFNRAVVVACGIGFSTAAFAGDPGDPNAMLTHNLEATASYYTMHDNDALFFDPASAYAECAHAQVGAVYNAYVAVTDRCASALAGVDIIEFNWSNLNMHSDMFGITASGVAQSTFSTLEDAEISLMAIENLSDLNAGASWSIQLFDGDSTFIGDLTTAGESYSLEKDTNYNVTFTIGGSNTLTGGGSTVAWQMAMAYSSGGGKAAVPGAGGLALLGGFSFTRRRRRR